MTSKSKFLLSTIILFALSACISGFSTERMIARGDDEIVRNFDSGQYLQTANNLLHFLNGKNDTKKTASLGHELLVDGPILPPAAAISISIGQVFKIPDWRAVLFMQTIFQALSSVLIFILTLRLTNKLPLAITSGLAWTLYPPGIIGSERLLTETLSIVLLLTTLILVSLILEWKQGKIWPFACLSLTCIILIFTKPALMFAFSLPVAVLIIFLIKNMAFGWKPLVALILPAAIGFALFAYTSNAMTGKLSLIPQRVPLLNVLVGNDLRTDGLAGVPQRTIAEDLKGVSQPTKALSIIFAQNPVGALDLMIRKIPRIFAEPWNDYRQPAILSRATEIRVVHQLLTALGLIGLTVSFIALLQFLLQTFKRAPYEEDFHTITAIALATSILGHLSFVLFEGVPRYGITVAPLMLVLFAWTVSKNLDRQRGFNAFSMATISAVSLVLLANLATIDNLLKLGVSQTLACILQIAIYLLLASILFFNIFKCGLKFVHGVSAVTAFSTLIAFGLFMITVALSGINESLNSEITCNLASNQFAEKRLDLGKGSEALGQKPSWALLLIDGDKHIANAKITVNNFELTDKPTSVYDFYQDRYPLLAFISKLASYLHTDVNNVRQWRTVQIPLKHLNLEGKNSIKIYAPKTGAAIVYGDFDSDSERALPGYRYVSQSRLFTTSRSMDWRQKFGFLKESDTASFRSIGSSESSSTVKPEVTQDLSNSPGNQKGQWRILVTLGIADNEEPPKIGIDGKVRSAIAPVAKEINLDSSHFTKSDSARDISFTKECGADFPLAVEKKDTHVIVELAGTASLSEADAATLVWNVALCGKDDPTTVSKGANLNCLGLQKPEFIVNDSGAGKLELSKGKPVTYRMKATFPLTVVQGANKTVRLRFVSLPKNLNSQMSAQQPLSKITLSNLKMTTHLERLPDLGQPKILTF
ncbi:MAG: hypothetical protein IAF58_12120 [Leptolyngbya sp.]|nr:hypothetical protein [Candidatus Melainabacteria bacterium]